MAADHLIPRLGVLWISGMADLSPMVTYLASCPEARATLVDIERHLHALDNSMTHRKVRDRAEIASEAGLLELSQNDICALTAGGIAYAQLLTSQPSGRTGLPEGARTSLRTFWMENLGRKGRLHTNLQQGILGLVQQGGDHRRLDISSLIVSAMPDVLKTTMQCLDDYGLLEPVTDQGYQLNDNGRVMAGLLGLVAPPPELPNVPDPKPATPPAEAGTAEDRLAQLLNERLKSLVLSQLELKQQVTALNRELEALKETVGATAPEPSPDSRLDEFEERLRTLETAYLDSLEGVGGSSARTEVAATLEALVERLSPGAPTPSADIPLVLVKSTAECRPVTGERVVLEDAHKRLNDAGYKIELKDLANLWTCTKAGQLTVLAGPPGSGKSSLVRMMSEALGHRSTLLEVTVRRGWTDDQPFMGGINRLHERYEPAPTGVVPHLLAANQDPTTGFYWCLLDEFNLSTPEYYFAEFISVLESDVPQVSLYTEGISLQNRETFPARIPLRPNLHFFGTVNLDDTASPLSPRLIDRANLLWIERQVGPDSLKSSPIKPPTVGPVSFAETMQKFVKPAEFTGGTRAWWDTLQRVLSSPDKECGRPVLISPRSMAGLARYVANAPQGVLDARDAFDFGMAQRVLPGLRGFGPAFGERLTRLQKWAAGERFSRTADLLLRLIQSGADTQEFDFLSGLW